MKIIIVTGLSGAGKTQAMDVLEDMGYYCIDNMPPSLIRSFLDMASKNKEIEKAAFGIDVRGGSLFDDLKDALEYMKKEELDFKILFFEASDSVLARRYNETRREHPLAHGESVAKGIAREKERLSELRSEADAIIDTSYFNNARLASEITNIVGSGKDDRTFTVNIMSFGYKHGMPVSADMVFDTRFLPNPFYIEDLKHLQFFFLGAGFLQKHHPYLDENAVVHDDQGDFVLLHRFLDLLAEFVVLNPGRVINEYRRILQVLTDVFQMFPFLRGQILAARYGASRKVCGYGQ